MSLDAGQVEPLYVLRRRHCASPIYGMQFVNVTRLPAKQH